MEEEADMDEQEEEVTSLSRDEEYLHPPYRKYSRTFFFLFEFCGNEMFPWLISGLHLLTCVRGIGQKVSKIRRLLSRLYK